jgi:hypothetical protein
MVLISFPFRIIYRGTYKTTYIMEKKVVVARLNAVNEQDVYVLSLEEELQLVDSIRLGGKACNASIEKLSQSKLSFITVVANRYVNEGSRNGLE